MIKKCNSFVFKTYKKGTDVKLVVRSTKLKYAYFCMATDEHKIFGVACSDAEPEYIPEKSFILAFGKIYTIKRNINFS